MKIALTSNNHKKIYNLLFIQTQGELLIATEDGHEIARLNVETAEVDDKISDTQFYLNFNIVRSKISDAVNKDWAAVHVFS